VDAEGLLDSGNELDEGKAVQAEISIELAIQANRCSGAGMKFLYQAADDIEQRFGLRFVIEAAGLAQSRIHAPSLFPGDARLGLS
jgi:hypothetical protein